MTIALIAALVTIGVGISIFWLMHRQEQRFGVLAGERIYQDTEKKPGTTLYAKTIPLVGKPDYLIKDKDVITPVEVKTGKTPSSPYMNHTMQLMAYCLLVEENFQKRPPGGYIKYPEREFKIAYTKEAEGSVRQLVTELLSYKKSGVALKCDHPEHNT